MVRVNLKGSLLSKGSLKVKREIFWKRKKIFLGNFSGHQKPTKFLTKVEVPFWP